MSIHLDDVQSSKDRQPSAESLSSIADTPLRVILSWDVIHLIYNLFYPAVLGAFIYNLLTKILPTAHSLLPRLIPNISNQDTSASSIWATATLVITFTVDFLLGKKLYVKFGNQFNEYIGRIALMELVLIVVVALAFASCHDKKIEWKTYFFLMLLFAVLINVFYVIMGKAIKKPAIDKEITRTLKWSLGGIAASSLIGLILAFTPHAKQAQWPLFLASGLAVLFAIYYLAVSMQKTSLAYPLSISGGNLNDPDSSVAAEAEQGSTRRH